MCQQEQNDATHATRNLRLKREQILRGRDAFQKIRQEGKRLNGKSLVLNYLVDPDHPRQVAFIVPKAVGDAVERNRIRRHMREIYRHLQDSLLDHLISIWIVRKGLADQSREEIRIRMMQIYTKAGLISSSEQR